MTQHFHSIVRTVAVIVTLVVPAAGFAQGRRTPTADSAAIGGSVGLFFPRAEGLDVGPSLEGFYEYYLDSRTSVRLGVGWAKPKFDRESEDSMRYVRAGGDLVYNWEGGAVHPFAGAGVGAYFLNEKDNGRTVGESSTKLGGSFFGGLEYFTSRTFSVKGEARYHVISNAGAFDPDGLELSIGVKTYF